ncbi:MAG: hypothetical protein ACOYNL_02615 [Rickettsiales bacterium]
MNLERILTIPSSRDGKMAYGIFAALVSRSALNEGLAQIGHNNDGAFAAFLMTGVLLYTVGLAMARFNTGRPLFESVKR